MAPGERNRFRRANTGTAWITAGTEPVILRSACRPATYSTVGGAITRRAKHCILEGDIFADYCSSKVMRHALKNFEYLRQFVVTPGYDDLERPEQLGRDQIEMRSGNGVNGNPDRGRFQCTVAIGYRMTAKRITAKLQFRTGNRQHRINMRFHFAVGPCQDRPQR